MSEDESETATSGHNLPPGWKGLYRELVKRLAAEHPDVRIDGCYAKLASLRLYLSGADTAACRLAEAYTARSKRTCEVCGGAGLIVPVPPHAVVHVLCEAHAPPGVYAGVARLGAIARERYGHDPSVYRTWLYRKHRQLGGRMPVELVAEARVDEVIRWLPEPTPPAADT